MHFKAVLKDTILVLHIEMAGKCFAANNEGGISQHFVAYVWLHDVSKQQLPMLHGADS